MQNLHRVYTLKSLAITLLKLNTYLACHTYHQHQTQGLQIHWMLPVSGQLIQLPGKPAAREGFAKVGLPVCGVSEAMQLPLATLKTGRSLKKSNETNIPARNDSHISRKKSYKQLSTTTHESD